MRAHGICLPANFKAHAAVARAHARHTPRRSHTTARITHHGIHDPHCHTLISLVIIHSRLQSFELQAPSTIEVSGPCHARRTRPMRPAQSRMIQSALGHFAKLRLSETETCYRIMLETAAARWRAAHVAICCPALQMLTTARASYSTFPRPHLPSSPATSISHQYLLIGLVACYCCLLLVACCFLTMWRRSDS